MSYEDFHYGRYCYDEGLYCEAAISLKKALDAGIVEAASMYADICWRNLDEANHTMAEAAMWYICAAEDAGDGDILSFLRSVSEDLIGDQWDRQQKIEKLASVFEEQRRKSK